MNIETNGSVVPEDSVAYAARIIDEQLKMFINFEEPVEEVVAPTKDEPQLNVNLSEKLKNSNFLLDQQTVLRMMKLFILVI